MAAANTPTLQDVVSGDLNYEIWAPIVKATLVERGLWDVVENGIPPDPSKVPGLAATFQAEDLSEWRDSVGKDTKALQILQCSLPDSVFRKTLSVSSAKDLWESLEQVPEHVSYATCFGDLTYDASMWMIYSTTTNHMTPHEKYFTTLDRTRRARVSFITGKTIMAQGTGDVRILTKEGKRKTIKNVLFVPGIVTNALSVGQLERSGYDVQMDTEKCAIWDRATGTMVGETRWEKRGFFLRFQAI